MPIREPALFLREGRQRGGLSPRKLREQPALPLDKSDSGGHKLPLTVQEAHREVAVVVRQLQRVVHRLNDVGRGLHMGLGPLFQH